MIEKTRWVWSGVLSARFECLVCINCFSSPLLSLLIALDSTLSFVFTFFFHSLYPFYPFTLFSSHVTFSDMKDTSDSTSIDSTLTALDSYVLLGNSGLRVSPLCLGAMTFGEEWVTIAEVCSYVHFGLFMI